MRPEANVLRNFSLTVEPGETVALVGPSGSGKSSVVRLLLRLYEIQGGQILLDGQAIQGLKLQDLRQAIGLVSQDVYLFHGTIAENSAYRGRDVDPAEVERAARLDFLVFTLWRQRRRERQDGSAAAL